MYIHGFLNFSSSFTKLSGAQSRFFPRAKRWKGPREQTMLSPEEEEEEREEEEEKALPELSSPGCYLQIGIWEGVGQGEVQMHSGGLTSWTPSCDAECHAPNSHMTITAPQ